MGQAELIRMGEKGYRGIGLDILGSIGTGR